MKSNGNGTLLKRLHGRNALKKRGRPEPDNGYEEDFAFDASGSAEDAGDGGEELIGVEDDPDAKNDENDLGELREDEIKQLLDYGQRSGNIGEAEPLGKTDDPLSLYLAEIRKYRNLEKEEEADLAVRAQHGDNEARELLINSNQRLLLAIAFRKFRDRGLRIEDLVAAGNEGLDAAIAKFDPSKGARLSTYASYDIKKAMRRAIYKVGDVIRLPESMHIQMSRIAAAEDRYKAEHGRFPDVKTLSAECGIKESTVRTLLFYKSLQYEYLDEPAGKDGDQSEKDFVKADDTLRVDTDAEEIVRRHLARLDDREARIIKSYFGLLGEEKKNLGDLAKEFGLARQRISQIKIQAEKKLEKNGMFDELRELY